MQNKRESNVRQKIAEGARNTVEKVKSSAGDTLAKARNQAERVASDKKEAAADRIGGYGSAIHESARSLEEKDPNIAWLTHQAADKLQQTADYVRERDLSELRDDAADFARRHPMAFFGGMFAAGLIVGNLLKASPRKARPEVAESDSSADNQGDSQGSAQPELTLTEPTAAAEWGGM